MGRAAHDDPEVRFARRFHPPAPSAGPARLSTPAAIAFRRVQSAFHARAQAASEACRRAGMSVPVETVLEKLQSKLDAKRKKRGR